MVRVSLGSVGGHLGALSMEALRAGRGETGKERPILTSQVAAGRACTFPKIQPLSPPLKRPPPPRPAPTCHL
jgi:hypothetical protein